MAYDADVIVIGAGLPGLVATAELVEAGRTVILLDQEPEQSIGGQAHWSFGGLFLVDSPEQRRMRIKDSREPAFQDSRCPACTRPGRRPDSAAAGCTAAARWRARSSAAASSPGARRAGRRRRPSADTRRSRPRSVTEV